MNDPLKARLTKLQKFSDSAKRRANLYSDIAKMDDSPMHEQMEVVFETTKAGCVDSDGSG